MCAVNPFNQLDVMYNVTLRIAQRLLEDELLFSLSNSKGDILHDIELIEGIDRKNLGKNCFSWVTLDLSLLPNTCSLFRPQTSVLKLGSTLPMILRLLFNYCLKA
jgi:hypothetical protein